MKKTITLEKLFLSPKTMARRISRLLSPKDGDVEYIRKDSVLRMLEASMELMPHGDLYTLKEIKERIESM